MTTQPKETNPKDAIAMGSGRAMMHLVPDTAVALMTLAFTEGALKYGKFNWRLAGVRSSVYLDAVKRHLAKWTNGEEYDPETGVPHLASAMACLAIVADAQACGKLDDDRPPRAPMAGVLALCERVTKGLKEKFKDSNPHQNTIADGASL